MKEKTEAEKTVTFPTFQAFKEFTKDLAGVERQIKTLPLI